MMIFGKLEVEIKQFEIVSIILIFYINLNTAKQHVDKHVVKMIVEYGQLLSPNLDDGVNLKESKTCRGNLALYHKIKKFYYRLFKAKVVLNMDHNILYKYLN